MAESELCATLAPPPLWAALPAPWPAARPQGAAGNAPWPAGQAGAQARPPQPQPSCWPLGLAAKWGAIALSLCLPAPHPARAPTPPPTTGTTQPWATRGTRLGHATPPGCTNTPTSATSAAAWPFAGGATLAWGPLVVRCTKPRRAGQAPVPPPRGPQGTLAMHMSHVDMSPTAHMSWCTWRNGRTLTHFAHLPFHVFQRL